MTTVVALDSIRVDGGTQLRAALNEDTIERYTDAVDSLPPVDVFYDGSEYWLGDGFHRLEAHRRAGHVEVACTVHPGQRRDAVLFAAGANAEHDSAGLARTNADKRRAVEALFGDEEWSTWSDVAISKQAGVPRRTVCKYRAVWNSASGKESGTGPDSTPPAGSRKVDAGGRTYPPKPDGSAPAPGARRKRSEPDDAQPIGKREAARLVKETARVKQSLENALAAVEWSLEDAAAWLPKFDADVRTECLSVVEEIKRLTAAWQKKQGRVT